MQKMKATQHKFYEVTTALMFLWEMKLGVKTTKMVAAFMHRKITF